MAAAAANKVAETQQILGHSSAGKFSQTMLSPLLTANINATAPSTHLRQLQHPPLALLLLMSTITCSTSRGCDCRHLLLLARAAS
jgi:hypothetical protein